MLVRKLFFCLLVSFLASATPFFCAAAEAGSRPVHIETVDKLVDGRVKKQQKKLRKRLKRFFKKYRKKAGFLSGLLGFFTLLGLRRKIKKYKRASKRSGNGNVGCGGALLGIIAIGLLLWLFELLFSNVWIGLAVVLVAIALLLILIKD